MSATRTAASFGAMLCALLSCSGQRASPGQPSATGSEVSVSLVDDSVTFVNKVWRVAASSGMTPGQLVIFLSEGTLVFAASHDRPALGSWRRDAEGLTMVEEGIPYRVDILELSGAEFRIRTHNPGGSIETRFVPADGTEPGPAAAEPDVGPPAPSEREEGNTIEMVGTEWRLKDLGGAGVLDGAETTLEFPEAGKAVGNASCNRFFGAVDISGASIGFGPLATTRKFCAEAVMNQETKYLQALKEAERFSLDGSALLIYSKGMERPLRFVPVDGSDAKRLR